MPRMSSPVVPRLPIGRGIRLRVSSNVNGCKVSRERDGAKLVGGVGPDGGGVWYWNDERSEDANGKALSPKPPPAATAGAAARSRAAGAAVPRKSIKRKTKKGHLKVKNRRRPRTAGARRPQSRERRRNHHQPGKTFRGQRRPQTARARMPQRQVTVTAKPVARRRPQTAQSRRSLRTHRIVLHASMISKHLANSTVDMEGGQEEEERKWWRGTRSGSSKLQLNTGKSAQSRYREKLQYLLSHYCQGQADPAFLREWLDAQLSFGNPEDIDADIENTVTSSTL